jgi:hypothetical protein
MDRREQAKQQQKHQMQMQRLSQAQGDNDSSQMPLFGPPIKVSHCWIILLFAYLFLLLGT